MNVCRNKTIESGIFLWERTTYEKHGNASKSEVAIRRVNEREAYILIAAEKGQKGIGRKRRENTGAEKRREVKAFGAERP